MWNQQWETWWQNANTKTIRKGLITQNHMLRQTSTSNLRALRKRINVTECHGRMPWPTLRDRKLLFSPYHKVNNYEYNEIGKGLEDCPTHHTHALSEVSLCPALCCRDQEKEPASHNCQTKNNQDKEENRKTYQILSHRKSICKSAKVPNF
jgi:hypothetical protein